MFHSHLAVRYMKYSLVVIVLNMTLPEYIKLKVEKEVSVAYLRDG